METKERPMTKELPILFSGPMVRAILAGRKTMTRRVIDPQPIVHCTPPCNAKFNVEWNSFVWSDTGPAPQSLYRCCPCPVGSRLWVKEAWRPLSWTDDGQVAPQYKADDFIAELRDLYTKKDYVFKNKYFGEWHSKLSEELMAAGCPEKDGIFQDREKYVKWRSGLFMPRTMARLFLEVTAVKAERVQDISEEDAYSEGVNLDIVNVGIDRNGYPKEMTTHIAPFSVLWDSLYAKPKPVKRKGKIVAYFSYPWGDVKKERVYRGKPWHVRGNPWVFAYTFKRIDE